MSKKTTTGTLDVRRKLTGSLKNGERIKKLFFSKSGQIFERFCRREGKRSTASSFNTAATLSPFATFLPEKKSMLFKVSPPSQHSLSLSLSLSHSLFLSLSHECVSN
jgi:hypothetical protein